MGIIEKLQPKTRRVIIICMSVVITVIVVGVCSMIYIMAQSGDLPALFNMVKEVA